MFNKYNILINYVPNILTHTRSQGFFKGVYCFIFKYYNRQVSYTVGIRSSL